jgi:hypothetical protein
MLREFREWIYLTPYSEDDDGTTNSVSDRERLNVVLKELEYLRAELLQKFTHHLQLFAIVPPALGLIITYLVTKGTYDATYILPILILPIAFRYLWEQQAIVIIGKYIRGELIEKRLTSIVGFRNAKAINDYDRYWLGYEHYWLDWETKMIPHRHFYWKYAAFLIFVFIPFIPCLVYGILFLYQEIFLAELNLSSILPSSIHVTILVIYLFISIYLSREFLIS